MLLEVNNVRKVYTTRLSTQSTEALKNVNFAVDNGEYVAIMGESGSGKTTLLNIIATFDKATSGNVNLNNLDLSKLKDKDLANFRRDNLGFVFQDFNLLDNFSIKDNILLPLVLANKKYKDMEKRLEKVTKPLGIDKLINKFPYEVSGGQRQRVAVARAIITNPALILADEPTGALDSKNADNLIKFIRESIKKLGQTMIMVSHDSYVAAYADKVYFLKDGNIISNLSFDRTNIDIDLSNRVDLIQRELLKINI